LSAPDKVVVAQQTYEKTILSDLQGAWSVLRHSVSDNAGFEGWERMLFHIEEATSWETVRHLERMKPLLLIVRNIALQGDSPEGIMQEIEDISEILDETLKTHPTKNVP
jgi:hypothetical protein